MPSLWEAFKNKLDERLNWNTFKEEVSQGLETMPEVGIAVTPNNLSKFSRLLKKNERNIGSFGGYPTVDELVAFFATKYPRIFKNVKVATQYTPPNITVKEAMEQKSRYDPLVDSVLIDPGKHEEQRRIISSLVEAFKNSRLRASDIYDEVRGIKNQALIDESPDIVGKAFAKYINMKYPMENSITTVADIFGH